MRKGTNPLSRLPAPATMEKIVFQVVTHLPSLTGYHKERFEIIKTCLTTMTRGAGIPFSLIVCDNGSIPELRQWIEKEINPFMYIYSKNIGKIAQRKLIAKMLPFDTVLCYSDDDIFYYADWLKPQLELLERFPLVSSVTGYPVRTSFRWGNKQTKEWAKKYATVTEGKFIPDEWEKDFAVSIGRDVAEHKRMTVNDLDTLIHYKGLEAYATSHHCQQVGYAGVISEALRFDGLAMGEERSFDNRLDEVGLRLATTKRLARHMGNVIDDELKDVIQLENAKAERCKYTVGGNNDRRN